jgi:predicted phosphodiesterase
MDWITDKAMRLCKEFPNTPSRALARILQRDVSKTTDITFEQAYTRIRYRRGAKGNYSRANLAELIESNTTERPHIMPMPKPKTEFDDWKIRQLKARKVLILSDVHVPYHDETALQLAIDKGKEEGVDAVLLNGDFMDFYGVSRYATDPGQRNFADELEMGRAMLEYLRSEFAGCQIWWKLGNHEERWAAWIWQRAPEVYGVEDFSIAKLMRTEKHNVRIISDMEPINIGGLTVLHGHEYRFAISNPVNPARGLYMRSKVSSMMGHLHQSSEHTESDLKGRLVTTWSVGCLCQLRPRYAPLNKWNHGFAVVDTTGEDDYRVSNYRIHGGKLL